LRFEILLSLGGRAIMVSAKLVHFGNLLVEGSGGHAGAGRNPEKQ